MRLLGIVAILWGMAGLAQAQVDWSIYRPAGFVTDYAQVIPPAERDSLEVMLRDLRTQYDVQLALVTLPTLQRYPIDQVSKYLYTSWDIGRPNGNKSALLLMSIQDDQVHLYVGMGLKGVLTTSWTQTLEDKLIPLVAAREPGAAAVAAAMAMVERVYQRAGQLPQRTVASATPRKLDSALAQAAGGKGPIAGAVGIGVLVAIAIGAVMHGGGRPTEQAYVAKEFERNRTGPFGGNKNPHMR